MAQNCRLCGRQVQSALFPRCLGLDPRLASLWILQTPPGTDMGGNESNRLVTTSRAGSVDTKGRLIGRPFSIFQIHSLVTF